LIDYAIFSCLISHYISCHLLLISSSFTFSALIIAYRHFLIIYFITRPYWYAPFITMFSSLLSFIFLLSFPFISSFFRHWYLRRRYFQLLAFDAACFAAIRVFATPLEHCPRFLAADTLLFSVAATIFFFFFILMPPRRCHIFSCLFVDIFFAAAAMSRCFSSPPPFMIFRYSLCCMPSFRFRAFWLRHAALPPIFADAYAMFSRYHFFSAAFRRYRVYMLLFIITAFAAIAFAIFIRLRHTHASPLFSRFFFTLFAIYFIIIAVDISFMIIGFILYCLRLLHYAFLSFHFPLFAII